VTLDSGSSWAMAAWIAPPSISPHKAILMEPKEFELIVFFMGQPLMCLIGVNVLLNFNGNTITGMAWRLLLPGLDFKQRMILSQ